MRLLFIILLQICITILLVGGISEIYFRYFYDQTDYFNNSKTSEDWSKRHVEYNSLGFRDYEHPKLDSKIKTDPILIAFIGDSFTFGQGIKNTENRFSNLTGDFFKSRYNAEYYNISKNGWNTVNELDYLLDKNNKLPKFDVIVVQFFINDIEGDYRLIYKNKNNSEYNKLVNAIFSKSNSQIIQFLRTNSYFYDFLYNQSIKIYYGSRDDFNKVLLDMYESPKHWNNLTQQFVRAKNYAKNNNSHLIFVLFPSMINLDKRYPLVEQHKKISNYLKENHIDYIDLYTVYKGLSTKQLTVNLFDQHPNEFANKLAAEAIKKKLTGLFKNK